MARKMNYEPVPQCRAIHDRVPALREASLRLLLPWIGGLGIAHVSEGLKCARHALLE